MESSRATLEFEEDYRRPNSLGDSTFINDTHHAQANEYTDNYVEMGDAQANDYSQANEYAWTNEYAQSYTNGYKYNGRSIHEHLDTSNICSDSHGKPSLCNDSDPEEPQEAVDRGFAQYSDDRDNSDDDVEQEVWTSKGKQRASGWKGKGVDRRG